MFFYSPAGGAASSVLCRESQARPETEDHPGWRRSSGCQNGEMKSLVRLILLVATSAVSTTECVFVCVVRRGSDEEPRLPEATKNPCSPEHCQDGKIVSCWPHSPLTSSLYSHLCSFRRLKMSFLLHLATEQKLIQKGASYVDIFVNK